MLAWDGGLIPPLIPGAVMFPVTPGAGMVPTPGMAVLPIAGVPIPMLMLIPRDRVSSSFSCIASFFKRAIVLTYTWPGESLWLFPEDSRADNWVICELNVSQNTIHHSNNSPWGALNLVVASRGIFASRSNADAVSSKLRRRQ